jgi:hypothetical protein
MYTSAERLIICIKKNKKTEGERKTQSEEEEENNILNEIRLRHQADG